MSHLDPLEVSRVLLPSDGFGLEGRLHVLDGLFVTPALFYLSFLLFRLFALIIDLEAFLLLFHLLIINYWLFPHILNLICPRSKPITKSMVFIIARLIFID